MPLNYFTISSTSKSSSSLAQSVNLFSTPPEISTTDQQTDKSIGTIPENVTSKSSGVVAYHFLLLYYINISVLKIRLNFLWFVR